MEKSPGYEIWSKRNTHFGGEHKIPATCCKTKDEGLRDRCQKDPNENNAYLEVCIVHTFLILEYLILHHILKNKTNAIE